MTEQVKNHAEAADKAVKKAAGKENFELGVKVLDDNVKRIDKGIRKISEEVHKLADSRKKS
jgi:hypothetical protein